MNQSRDDRPIHTDSRPVCRTAKGSVTLSRAGALASIGMLVMVLLIRENVPPKDGGEQAAFYLMLFFAISSLIFFIVSLRRQCSYIVLHDNGIQQYLPNGLSLYLAWPEIGEIRDNRTLGQLELIPTEKSTLKTLKVDYQLEDFARLKTLIYEKTNTNDRDLLLSVFHRSNSMRMLMTAATALFGVVCGVLLFKGRFALALVVFLFVLGTRLAYRSEISSISIHDEYLSLHYPKRSRRIFFSSIRNLKLVSPKGIDLVMLEVDGKEIRLGGFLEGSIALYRRLRVVVPKKAQASFDDPDPSHREQR